MDLALPHNNSNQNMKPHHLYEIIDKEGEDIFKYGISCEPIGKDPTVSAVNDGLQGAADWIQITPMPVVNEFTIKGNASLFQVEIYDSVGRILRKIDTNKPSHTIDISAFPAGFYYVKTIHQTDSHSRVLKIVKL
ncbi:MAG: hypothetical protein RIR11_2848 [Bacteroidota bacterium]|jgi:hypothetical protein